jgi:hypothetical protein
MMENPYFNQEPYVQQINTKLLQYLLGRYPRFLGEVGVSDFRLYAVQAIRSKRPSTGNLFDYGEHFIEELQKLDVAPWLVDLARLDWALGLLPEVRNNLPDMPIWLNGMSMLDSYFDLTSIEHTSPRHHCGKKNYFWCIPWHPIPVCLVPVHDVIWLMRLDGSRSLRKLLAKHPIRKNLLVRCVESLSYLKQAGR